MSAAELTGCAADVARTPFVATNSRTLPYGRQLGLLSATAALSFVAAGLSLAVFYASDFVQGTKGGPIRGYSSGQLYAFLLWLVAGPVAIGSAMKATLIMYKVPEATLRSRILVSAPLCIAFLLVAFAGAMWLQASELLSCGYLWCYDAEATANDVTGFKASVGSQVFFLAVLLSCLPAALICRALSQERCAPPGSQGKASAAQMLAQMKRAERANRMKQNLSALTLLIAIPMMLLLTGLLPNTWERFSRAQGPAQAMHSLKFFMGATMGTDGVMKSEKPGAWLVTQNWRWSDDVVVKLFPDTVLFYGFLEGIVLVLFVQARSKLVKEAVERRFGGVTVGRMLLGVWFVGYLFLFIWYWAVDHLYHGDGKFDAYSLEKPARVSGLVALMALALTLLPASKSSPVLAAAGVSWESALWVHICLAVLFLAASCLHVFLYFVRFCQLGHGLDILPFNPMFWYPQNPIGGTTPSDNWAVPVMASVFWPGLVIFGVFPWMRRKSYELFRYTHNYFMVLIPAAFWHATHAWYFLLPGVALWLLDRMLRFLSATESVALQDYMAHSVDCWTDAKPGQPSRNLQEKITKVAFTWPGQARVHSPGMYVLVNLPQVSLAEWHPFSLSSSPLDSTATLHIKHMGQDTFTGKLHELMSEAPNHGEVLMNVQGPYGPRIDLNVLPHIVLIAGGIGATPMVNSLRCAVQRARSGEVGVLKRLHFVWSARSPDVFGIFNDELAFDTAGLPFELKISLYCSTIHENISCEIGVVNSGMPNFAELLPEEAALGPCFVRACGPPPMVNACAKVAETLKDTIDFEPWSFSL